MKDPPPATVVRYVAEAVVAAAVPALIWLMFGNYWDAYVRFFGDTTPYTEANVSTYRVLTVALVAAVVVSLALAIWRRARWAYLWHAPAALSAVAAAALLAVPSIDWKDVLTPDPQPPHSPAAPPCHSGSNDCPGG